MNWDELNGIWSRQDEGRPEKHDLAALQAAFAVRQRKTSRQLFWRDVREGTAAMVVAGAFAGTGWQMGRAGWPLWIAAAMLLALGGFFARERWRARRLRPAAEVPLLVRIDAEIAEQQHQRQLLQSVGSWYLGPIVLAAAILMAVVLVHAPIPVMARLLAGAAMSALLLLVGWVTLGLNRAAVRNAIEPHLQELETLRAGLQATE